LASILWFGPSGAFFRPGRLIQQPARAAAVKDGRHADLTARSAASRTLLDGREHDGILARNGNARSQSSPLPIKCSARKHIKIRDPAYHGTKWIEFTSIGHASVGKFHWLAGQSARRKTRDAEGAQKPTVKGEVGFGPP
jgi:hypothetical protein